MCFDFDWAVQYLWIESITDREGSSLLPLLMQDPTMTDWKEAVFWQYARRGWQGDTPNPISGKMGELILIMCFYGFLGPDSFTPPRLEFLHFPP